MRMTYDATTRYRRKPPPVDMSIRRSNRNVIGDFVYVVANSRLSDVRRDNAETINIPVDSATTQTKLPDNPLPVRATIGRADTHGYVSGNDSSFLTVQCIR